MENTSMQRERYARWQACAGCGSARYFDEEVMVDQWKCSCGHINAFDPDTAGRQTPTERAVVHPSERL